MLDESGNYPLAARPPRVLPVAAIERVVRMCVTAFRADTHEKTMTGMGGKEPRARTSHSVGLTPQDEKVRHDCG